MGKAALIIETRMDMDAVTYSASNTAETDRNVLIEMPRRTNGWSLDDGMKADETTPDLYRFRLPVAAHQTAKLEVRQHGPESTSVTLNPEQDYRVFLLDLVKRVPDAKEQLEPVIEAEGAIADLDRRITESKQQEQTAIADEARARENVTALKGNDAGKRFVDELNRAEDTLQSTRKQIADLQTQRKAAVDKLNQLISNLSFDWDVKPQS